MVILRVHGVAVHVLAEVGERRSAMEMVVTVVAHQGHTVGWPMHSAALRCRRGVLTTAVGHGVVDFGRVDSALVRSSLVLDHGCLSAEAGRGNAS